MMNEHKPSTGISFPLLPGTVEYWQKYIDAILNWMSDYLLQANWRYI